MENALSRFRGWIIGTALLFGLAAGGAAVAQDNFVGEIRVWPGSFVPVGWARCDGQLLSISQNIALFTLLGTKYGGNGQSTFALPNLQGRISIHAGQGPGLGNYLQGQGGGEEFHTLTPPEMPAHTHTAYADSAAGIYVSPEGMYPAQNAAGIPQYGPSFNGIMAAPATSATGGGQPHENRPRYLVLDYIIAVQGIFPSHSAPAGRVRPSAKAATGTKP